MIVAATGSSGPTLAEPQPAQLALPTPAQLLAGERMRISIVRAEGPACDPNCPMWIAAEGMIVPGSADRLRQVIQSLAGRRLPILINSPGGFLADAMAMGRLIRRNSLSIGVASTHLVECDSAGRACDDQRATSSLAAVCGSACPLVLAGGVRRYVSHLSFVGVHELMILRTITHTMPHYRGFYRIVEGRKQEISRRLVSEDSSTNSSVAEAAGDVERSAADYFGEMGVGSPSQV